jgi:hypothetical protein
MPSYGAFGCRSICRRSLVLGLTVVLLGLAATELRASISYTTVNSSYAQDFDTLPTGPTNTSLQSTIPWIDDSTSSATNTSLPGWYLYHNTTQTEGGTNGHQRLRIGPGSSGTGAFYDFGVAGTNPDTDRALGNLTSSTIGTSFYGLRLTNNTGITLGQFTLTYTGEQWRDGGATSPATSVAQTATFGYAVTSATPTDIGDFNATTNPGGITGVVSASPLNFTSPIFGSTPAVTLDGNAPANRILLSATVGGFTWLPGEDLWLRWSDVDHASNDHGMAVDDLTFSADVPAVVNSVANGLASAGTTWSDGLPPSAGKGYHVINGHIVTLDAAFPGSVLSVENGSVDINAGGSGQFFQSMTIESGGNLTESVAGDISVGNDATSGLKLNRDVAFNLDANSKFQLKATLTGTGKVDFNAAAPGSAANAEVNLDATSGHTGAIRFNAGKQVNITETAAHPNLEMNSADAGGNILWWEPKSTLNAGKVTFNQPGTFVHAVGVTTPTTGNFRLQGPPTLIANAAVTIDMSNPYNRDERRYLIGTSFQGSGDLTVKGTATDPTSASSVDNTTGITLNEFEVGAQGTDPSATSFEPYSGTISTQDFVNVEIRRNLPSAKFIVNQNGRMETGAQPIPLTNGAGTTIGEIVVNSGGVLEVGFEQANAVAGTFTEGHHTNHLHLVSTSGKNGSLTLTGGATPSTLRMQINGTAADQFDRIELQGNGTLGGTLDVLVNPVSCTGNDPCGANLNGVWSPTIGETFDIIKLVLAPVVGDYDGNGTAGNEDYGVWRSTFGDSVTAGTGADGNKNGVIDSADYVLWRNNLGGTSSLGTFNNTQFNSLNIVDPTGALAAASATLQVNYSATMVQLQVVSLGSGTGLAAVPEPSTIALLALIAPFVLRGRRVRS